MKQNPAYASERNIGLDCLRIVSMLLVLFLHVLGQGGILGSIDKAETPDSYNVAWLLETAAFCAVNCYALISGYVGVKSKFKYSNIVVLWMQVAFYTVGFTVLYSFVKPEALGDGAYFSAFFPVLKNAYWYFTAYFAIFFLTPLLNRAVNTMPKRQMLVTVITIVVIYSVLYTLSRTALLGTPISDLLIMKSGYSPIWLIILYIIGAYIQKYREDFKLSPSLAFLIYAVAVLISWIEKLTVKNSILVSYTSPTILIAAIALLLAFSAIRFNRIGRIVAFLSPASFGVYLIHVNPLVWSNFMKGHFAALAKLSAPLMALATVGTVLSLYVICTAIDLLRHYLFKLIKIKPALASLEARLVGNLWQSESSQNKTN